MVSLLNAPNKLVSIHGKALLREFKNNPNAEIIMDYIRKDPLAALLKDKESGNNTFHIVLGSGFRKDFIVPILNVLLEYSPDGLRAKNKDGALPIHVYLSQYIVNFDILLSILTKYPQSASIANNYEMIPLFLCVMRDDSSVDICKALCKAYPDGPSCMNKTHSHPLHFAAKRSKPNIEILKILIRRYREAAMKVNDFGLLPLHCIVTMSDNLEAISLIYKEYPEAIKICDRQGRTCLHLAEHSNAVDTEIEEIVMTREREKMREQNQKDDKNNNNNIYEDYESDDNEVVPVNSELYERNGKSRYYLRYLIKLWPQSLVMENNFQATPVETVLEKTRSVQSKKKIVSVFGLYDDPPTARLLLLFHQFYSSKNMLPRLKLKHVNILKDLNWIARKDAVFVSLVGEPRPGSVEAKKLAQMKQNILLLTQSNNNINQLTSLMANVSVNEKEKRNKVNNNNKIKNKSVANNTSIETDDINILMNNYKFYFQQVTYQIPNNNLLARIRRSGHMELMQLIISWI